MFRRKFNHDENFNLYIQRAIDNQDVGKTRALIRSALRRRKYIDLTSELSRAVELGNKDLVQLIYLYYRGESKLVPKIILTKQGQKDIRCFEFLLDNGFNIKPRDPDMKPYMHLLIRNQYDNFCIKLLTHDVDVNLKDDLTGYSLIHTACGAVRMKVVKYLIQRNVNVNVKVEVNDGSNHFPIATRYMGKTALYIAVDAGNIQLMKILLKNGANPNDSWAILAAAVQRNRKDIINLLLKYGVNVNITNTCGKAPLHFCVSNFPGHSVDVVRSEIAKMLLDNGADVNAKTMSGCTPLFAATKHAYVKVMKVLINYNADIYVTKNGNNLIHIALGLNNYEVLEMIWKFIPSDDYEKFINVKNNQGQTPLHIGTKNGHIRGVQTLLNNHADVNLIDNNGKTPLHIAIETVNLVITEALLAKNPNVNIKDKNGQTPLHYAAKIDQKGIIFIQQLINHGAHINSVDIDGRVPLHFACGIKNTQVIYNLLKNGAKTNVKDKFEQTPLHWACNTKSKLTENVKIFELLLENEVHINSVDSTGNSPLHYAVANGSIANTKLLLKAGADINLINNKNETAVDYVSENMLSIFHSISVNDKIAQYLREHIIQLKVANLYVCDKNIKLVYNVKNNDANIKWIKRYEKSCKEELCRMKKKKFDGTDITYYNVLMRNVNYRVDITFDEDITLGIMSDELSDNFSLYADILKSRFKVARLRRELYDQIRKYTESTYFEILPDNCFDEIFHYFNIGALKAFIDAIKPISKSSKYRK